MPLRRDVEVQLEFLASEHGGRSGPVRSGYRPQLFYDGHDWDAQHEYPDVDEVRPGERARAYLTCLSPQFHDGNLVPGKAVLFREGQRVVAFGTVTEVIELPAAAYRARVEEALERYYLALGRAGATMNTANDRDRYRAAFEQAACARVDVRERGDLSSL